MKCVALLVVLFVSCSFGSKLPYLQALVSSATCVKDYTEFETALNALSQKKIHVIESSCAEISKGDDQCLSACRRMYMASGKL